MSRLHSQKRRLRAQQRGDGLIDPGSDQVDRDAFVEIGSTHQAAREALELVERTGAAEEAEPLPTPLESQDVRPAPAAALPASLASTGPDMRYTPRETARVSRIVDGFMSNLSPAELEEVRAHLERRTAVARPSAAPLEHDPAQNPPTS